MFLLFGVAYQALAFEPGTHITSTGALATLSGKLWDWLAFILIGRYESACLYGCWARWCIQQASLTRGVVSPVVTHGGSSIRIAFASGPGVDNSLSSFFFRDLLAC